MSRLDAGGRITDQTTLAKLQWLPGDRIRFSIRDALIIATPDPAGQRELDPHGLLRLPVAVRRACRLRAGDRILLAALPTRQRLIIHPPATLATLTAAVHHSVAGGEHR
jgi:hypothetical protein